MSQKSSESPALGVGLGSEACLANKLKGGSGLQPAAPLTASHSMAPLQMGTLRNQPEVTWRERLRADRTWAARPTLCPACLQGLSLAHGLVGRTGTGRGLPCQAQHRQASSLSPSFSDAALLGLCVSEPGWKLQAVGHPAHNGDLGIFPRTQSLRPTCPRSHCHTCHCCCDVQCCVNVTGHGVPRWNIISGNTRWVSPGKISI